MNKVGSTVTQSTLSVTGAPTIIRRPNSEVFVAEKKTIKIEYEVFGIPVPEVKWFKNDIAIVFDTRVKSETRLKTVNMLSIDNTQLADAAKYSVIVKNDSGELTESFNLIVQSNLSFKFIES